MARTHVQQSQISGSLLTDFDDALTVGESLAGQSNLVGDLNALRTQINKIIGQSHWYDALTGSQDLSDIFGAMHASGANADFMGNITAVGDVSAVSGTFSGDLSVTGELSVDGNVTLGDSSSDTITFTAVAATDLAMASHKVSGLAQADTSGDALGWGQVAYVTDLTASGKIFANNAGDASTALYVVDADGSIKASDKMFFDGSLFQLSGSADISGSLTVGSGLTVVDGGLTVAGDSMEITGSFTVVGDSAFSGSVSIEGDIATRLYIVGPSGELYDEASLSFSSGVLFVTGALNVGSAGVEKFTVDASGNVDAAGTLNVVGNSTLASVDVGGGYGSAGATISGTGDISADGDLTAAGNVVLGTNDSNTIEFKGELVSDIIPDVDKTYDLGSNSKAWDKLYVNTGSLGFLSVSGDAEISGDLRVKGAMTYIETTNLKVQDAFIHLATGSTGTSDMGVVLHSGGGADDLIMGQNGNDGAFIFGHKDVEGTGAGQVDGDNDIQLSGISLADAWMSGINLGGVEGSLSGSLVASASGLDLSSAATKDLNVTAAADLMLAGNGETAISFIESGEYTTFSGSFGGSSSIVGALNSLASAAASSAAKAVYYSTDFTGDVLDFSTLGVVPSGDHKYVDVYLNGVLLSQGLDVVSVATGSVTLENGIVSGLTGDDVITVTLRNAS